MQLGQRTLGLLLACLAASCSVPDGLMLNISVPPTVKVKSYVIKVQERSTRKVVFLSGLQQIAAGRDLSVEPLRVAMPFNQRGKVLLQVLAANVDNVDTLPQPGVNEPQLFFAKIVEVSELQELSAPLVLERTAALASELPVIMVGDYNSQPSDPAYAILTEGVDGAGPRFADAFVLLLPIEII